MFGWGRKKKAAKPAAAAAAVVSGIPADPTAAIATTPAVVRALRENRGGGVAMEGHAPTVKVTHKRTHCDDLTDEERELGVPRRSGCGRPVYKSQRHICIYNAHHHLATLTARERDQLIADLKALGVKDSVPVRRESPKRKPRTIKFAPKTLQ